MTFIGNSLLAPAPVSSPTIVAFIETYPTLPTLADLLHDSTEPLDMTWLQETTQVPEHKYEVTPEPGLFKIDFGKVKF